MTRRRRAAAVGLLLLALPAGLLAGCSGQDAVDQAAGGGLRFVSGDTRTGVIPVADRGPAPALTGTLLSGAAYDGTRELAGKVAVVNFWGSWCAPCRAEADNLVRVAEATAAQGVQFLGVNVKDRPAAARAFEANQGVPYPSLDDPAGRVAVQFRRIPPSAIPSTVVIDRAGRVAAVFLGATTEDDLLPVVTAVAAEPG